MKIDATRYTMFWQNPEKYRLREVWKLAPKEPKPGTFASLLTYGRRRGTCFHELMDGAYPKWIPSSPSRNSATGDSERRKSRPPRRWLPRFRNATRTRRFLPMKFFLSHLYQIVPIVWLGGLTGLSVWTLVRFGLKTIKRRSIAPRPTPPIGAVSTAAVTKYPSTYLELEPSDSRPKDSLILWYRVGLIQQAFRFQSSPRLEALCNSELLKEMSMSRANSSDL